MPFEARVLSAAVTFVALGEKRLWRNALSSGEVAQRLRSEASEGRFDAEIVEALIDTRDASPAGSADPAFCA